MTLLKNFQGTIHPINLLLHQIEELSGINLEIFILLHNYTIMGKEMPWEMPHEATLQWLRDTLQEDVGFRSFFQTYVLGPELEEVTERRGTGIRKYMRLRVPFLRSHFLKRLIDYIETFVYIGMPPTTDDVYRKYMEMYAADKHAYIRLGIFLIKNNIKEDEYYVEKRKESISQNTRAKKAYEDYMKGQKDVKRPLLKSPGDQQ